MPNFVTKPDEVDGARDGHLASVAEAPESSPRAAAAPFGFIRSKIASVSRSTSKVQGV